MIGCPAWWLCQLAGVKTSSRWQDPNAHPVDGATAMTFQVQLALEGVVDRLDELAKRPEPARAGPRGLTSLGRSQQVTPRPVRMAWVSASRSPLSTTMRCPGRAVSSVGSTSNRLTSTSRSSALGWSARRCSPGRARYRPGAGAAPEGAGSGGAGAIAGPAGQRRPLDARARAAALHRVESATPGRRPQSSVSIANAQMRYLPCATAARSRLLEPAWPGS
jgi:hypothetical protein